MVDLILKVFSFTGVVAAIAICALIVFAATVLVVEIVRALRDMKEGR